MITTTSILSDLSAIALPIAVVAAVLAVLAALVAGGAFVADAAESGGIATAFWLAMTGLSLAGGVVSLWTPLVVALAAGGTSLVLSATVGVIRRRPERRLANASRRERRPVASRAREAATDSRTWFQPISAQAVVARNGVEANRASRGFALRSVRRRLVLARGSRWPQS